MTKTFLIYGHGGCYNHGCEALVQSGIKLLRYHFPDCRIIVSTHNKEHDIEFNLPADEIVDRDLAFLRFEKTSGYSIDNNDKIYKSTIDKITNETICIHLGGDNYCYENWKRYAHIHQRAIEKGAVSVIWSCSLDSEFINEEMLSFLRTHHLIAARDAVTYRILKQHHFKNVVKVSDIAFLLQPEAVDFPLKNYISITVGPLASRKETIPGIAIKSFQNLLDYILENTEYNIALVPHVIHPADNDIETMVSFDTHGSDRVHLVKEHYSAAQLKYIIGNAQMCITLRTHASIAAYSMCVPTLVTGYSSKSIGIAEDIDMLDYVLPVREIADDKTLTKKFIKLTENKDIIQEKLKKIIPIYIKSAISGEMFRY